MNRIQGQRVENVGALSMGDLWQILDRPGRVFLLPVFNEGGEVILELGMIHLTHMPQQHTHGLARFEGLPAKDGATSVELDMSFAVPNGTTLMMIHDWADPDGHLRGGGSILVGRAIDNIMQRMAKSARCPLKFSSAALPNDLTEKKVMLFGKHEARRCQRRFQGVTACDAVHLDTGPSDIRLCHGNFITRLRPDNAQMIEGSQQNFIGRCSSMAISPSGEITLAIKRGKEMVVDRLTPMGDQHPISMLAGCEVVRYDSEGAFSAWDPKAKKLFMHPAESSSLCDLDVAGLLEDYPVTSVAFCGMFGDDGVFAVQLAEPGGMHEGIFVVSGEIMTSKAGTAPVEQIPSDKVVQAHPSIRSTVPNPVQTSSSVRITQPTGGAPS